MSTTLTKWDWSFLADARRKRLHPTDRVDLVPIDGTQTVLAFCKTGLWMQELKIGGLNPSLFGAWQLFIAKPHDAIGDGLTRSCRVYFGRDDSPWSLLVTAGCPPTRPELMVYSVRDMDAEREKQALKFYGRDLPGLMMAAQDIAVVAMVEVLKPKWVQWDFLINTEGNTVTVLDVEFLPARKPLM